MRLTRLKPQKLCRSSKESGFSLLEILITMLIVAIGSLGIAGTILTGMRASTSSVERIIATQHISALIEKMGANIWAKDNGVYHAPFGTALPIPACVPTGCQPVDQSTVDLANARARIGAAIPNGQVQVIVDRTVSPPIYSVTMAWFEQAAQDRSASGVTEAATSRSGCGAVPFVPGNVNQCLTISFPVR